MSLKIKNSNSKPVLLLSYLPEFNELPNLEARAITLNTHPICFRKQGLAEKNNLSEEWSTLRQLKRRGKK